MDDLNRLAADLQNASFTAGVKVVRLLDESGEKIRDEARRTAPKTGLPHYAKAITHELKLDGLSLAVEVGPEKGGQGSLGHILENGTAKSPPQAHMGPALDRVAPDFVKGVVEIGGEIL